MGGTIYADSLLPVNFMYSYSNGKDLDQSSNPGVQSIQPAIALMDTAEYIMEALICTAWLTEGVYVAVSPLKTGEP